MIMSQWYLKNIQLFSIINCANYLFMPYSNYYYSTQCDSPDNMINIYLMGECQLHCWCGEHNSQAQTGLDRVTTLARCNTSGLTWRLLGVRGRKVTTTGSTEKTSMWDVVVGNLQKRSSGAIWGRPFPSSGVWVIIVNSLRGRVNTSTLLIIKFMIRVARGCLP